MHSKVDEQLRFEAGRFALRYTCESCAHFDDAGARCSLGYPSEAHRERDLRAVEWVTFCKHFELA